MGPLDEEKKSDLYETLMKKYGQATEAEDKKLEEAKSDATKKRLAGGLIDGVTQMFQANAVGRGVNVAKPMAGQILNSAADQSVSDAAADRKKAVEQYLFKNDLEDKVKKDGYLAEDRKVAADKRSKELADAASSEDANSSESQLARSTAKQFAPNQSFEGMSAKEINKVLPYLKDSASIDATKQNRTDAATVRAETLASDREYKEGQKQIERDEKKKTLLNEIEDRRTNINSALDTLDTMIKDKGTFEMSGSHNQDMDRLVDQIATDMAKLQDPSSVARPTEVQSIKDTLVKPGMSNTNATARDIIKNFRGEVERRADGAYKIRGIDKPVSAVPPPLTPKDQEALDWANANAEDPRAAEIKKKLGQ